MITDIIILIVLIIILFFSLPLIFFGLFLIVDKFFKPVWEWYMGILAGWYDSLEGDDE